MAFVNERLTREEGEEFKAKAIENPGNRFMILDPSKRTIDHDKNVFLVWALQEREEPYDNYFVLFWKDTPIPVELRDTWVEKKTCRWQILRIKIPADLERDRNEIIQSLKDALTVYGFNGSPDEPFDAINKSTNVEFNF